MAPPSPKASADGVLAVSWRTKARRVVEGIGEEKKRRHCEEPSRLHT
jgi:hypothetical protein